MGLDLVELVVSIEQHFGIEIPNSDAQRLYTPRAIIDYLTPRLAGRDVGSALVTCLTQQAFYRVRHALKMRTGASRVDIMPDCPLDNLIPRRHRTRVWDELRVHVVGDQDAVTWPNLKRPAWLARVLVSAGGGAFLLLLGYGMSNFSPGLGIALAVCMTATLAFAMERLTTPWRTEFQPVGFTVGDLARIVATHNALDRSKPNVWTHERIAQDVRALVMSELGISTLTDDTRFVEDLGVD